jgi:hypothetical protein
MKRIDKLQSFKPQSMHGTCTLLFDKAGLKVINTNPNAWRINDFGNKLCNTNGIQEITIKGLCNHHLCSLVRLATDYIATIENIQIKRLADITEGEAKRSGVENKDGNRWKHYCPELFYSVLQQESQYFETALGSFHSLWMKKHGIAEIFANPWVWQYTIKYDKIRSEKK